MDTLKLVIETENGNISGRLQKTNFNPLTVLGDLTATIKGISCEDNYNRAGNAFQQIFGIFFTNSDYFEFFEKMVIMRKMIYCNQYLSIAELERLKPFFKLQFDFDIVNKKLFPINENQMEVFFDPLRLGYCDIEKAIENSFASEHIFIYRCYSMEDVAFAILHYLLLNEYKFRQCEHCLKFFATKTLKQKYCTRKSPIKQHEHLPCYEAVDHIMKKIKKNKKSIMENIRNYYPNADIPFSSEFNSYGLEDGKPAKCSWYTLEILEKITSKNYRQKWYKPEYK